MGSIWTGKKIWSESSVQTEKQAHENSMVFPIGEPNTDFSNYFIGQSYLAPLSKDQVGIYNVTFEPSCRNNWHIHKASKGGGQILICMAGKGYYQELGKKSSNSFPRRCGRYLLVSSIGMVQQKTAGFLTSPLKCPAKIHKPSGVKKSLMKNTKN